MDDDDEFGLNKSLSDRLGTIKTDPDIKPVTKEKKPRKLRQPKEPGEKGRKGKSPKKVLELIIFSRAKPETNLSKEAAVVNRVRDAAMIFLVLIKKANTFPEFSFLSTIRIT